jgi:hypothetical protein
MLGLPDQSDSRGTGDRSSLIVIRDLMFGNRPKLWSGLPN